MSLTSSSALRPPGLPISAFCFLNFCFSPESRRNHEGAFYTPAFITRHIVEQALGGVLKQRFESLRQQQEAKATGTARKALADPDAYDLNALNEPQRKALIRFREAGRMSLTSRMKFTRLTLCQ